MMEPALATSRLLDIGTSPELSGLSQLADDAMLLAFDFDGTLAPLVPQRDAARMRPATAVLFAAVCARYPTVVISGRARDDVLARLGLARPLAVIGNHGREDGSGNATDHEADRALMRRAIALLAPLLGGPLDLEDKTWSLSLHIVAAPGTPAPGELLATATALLQPLASALRVQPGHRVINVVAATAPHKGQALATLLRDRPAARALFVGDDVTDEDVFRAALPGLVGVRIGYTPDSAAAYYLPTQHDIDRLLAHLIRGRPRPLVIPRSA
jgi:trehalose 6-phosphate phosphatase